MGRVSIEESTLTAIGNSIRLKTGKADMIPPLSMPAEIESIQGGGGDAIIKTVSGACPVTLEDCVEGSLLDYKIYGAEGGVGDKTANLFNIKAVYFKPSTSSCFFENNGLKLSFSNESSSAANYFSSSDLGAFNLEPDKTYTSRCKITETEFTSGGGNSGSMNKSIMWQDNTTFSSNTKVYIVNGYAKSPASDGYFYTTFTTPSDISSLKYFVTRLTGYTNTTIEELMIAEGSFDSSNFPEYISYGYKVDIKVNDVQYLVFPSNPLIDGDYIDFENRVIVKDGISSYIDLPEIPLPEGTNTFDVDTTVKPSNVDLTYVKKVEFNTMKTVESTVPLTVDGAGQRLEGYRIYGADGEALYYGDNNEYIAYDYITTNQSATGASNKAGFNSGIKWSEVNKFRFSIRNNTSQENNMIFAAKSTNENICSALASPWIGIGQATYQSNSLTGFTYENHPEPGVFGIDTLSFTTPTSTSYIWVASWMDSAWSRNNDWGFVEFYKDDILVAAFYPAKRISDGVFGFYNTVAGVFITCGAAESAFIGNAPSSDSVGDLSGNFYLIPIRVNDEIINIESPLSLGKDDYIDFENRIIVKDGMTYYCNLPEIYLQNGQNIIDVDTTVKPSKMAVSFVDNAYSASHIVTEASEFSCENEATIYRSACEQVIKSPRITNPAGILAYHWNQLNDNGYISTTTTQNGVTFTNIGNGKLVLSGTTTARAMMPVVSSNFMATWDTSHKYYLRKLYPGSSTSSVFWHTFNKQVASIIILGSDMNFTANYPRVSVAQNFDTTGIEIIPQIFDLTAMFGEGNEPTMEQFDAMFPESYYPFNEGVDVYNLPITINGVAKDIKYEDGISEFYPEDKIIIPEGDSTISLPGTLSGTYLKSVSAQ